MYLGQIEPSTIDTWVLDEELMLMRKKSIKYSPALNKVGFQSRLISHSQRDRFHRMFFVSSLDLR